MRCGFGEAIGCRPAPATAGSSSSGENRMKRALPMLVLICGCAGEGGRPQGFSGLEAEAKSVCELMADPAPYVGREIMLTGVYFATPHERLLVDPDCPQGSLRVSHSLRF